MNNRAQLTYNVKAAAFGIMLMVLVLVYSQVMQTALNPSPELVEQAGKASALPVAAAVIVLSLLASHVVSLPKRTGGGESND